VILSVNGAVARASSFLSS